MAKFSRISNERLLQCDTDLQWLANKAIEYADFTIVTGHRSAEEQNDLYHRGFSTLKYPNSKHNSRPSIAVDVAPYIPPYGVLFGGPEQLKRISQQTGKSQQEVTVFIQKAYARLIGIFEGLAYTQNIKLRVGMDWNGNFDMLDQTFHDLGHIELI